jgi:hypothetical protein
MMAVSFFVAFFLVGLPMLLGYYLIYVGMRFKKSAGATVDQTAFWGNWIVFVWSWAERAKEIVAALPFFSRDLTENFGIKPDDGRIT